MTDVENEEYLMGCLFELIFDIILEGSMELCAWCWMKLIQLIVPWKTVSARTRKIIECVTGILGISLFLALMIGIIMLLQDGSITKTVGRYVTLISLGISVLPIVLGAIVWVIRHFKNRKSTF